MFPLLDDVVVVVVSASHQNPQDFNDDTSSSAAATGYTVNWHFKVQKFTKQFLGVATKSFQSKQNITRLNRFENNRKISIFDKAEQVSNCDKTCVVVWF